MSTQEDHKPTGQEKQETIVQQLSEIVDVVVGDKRLEIWKCPFPNCKKDNRMQRYCDQGFANLFSHLCTCNGNGEEGLMELYRDAVEKAAQAEVQQLKDSARRKTKRGDKKKESDKRKKDSADKKKKKKRNKPAWMIERGDGLAHETVDGKAGSGSPSHSSRVDPGQRSRWLCRFSALGLATGMLLTPKLWIATGRSFPSLPVSDALPPIPFPCDLVWAGSLLLLLLLIGIKASNPRRFIVIFIILFGLLCLWDQQRLDAWAYQYFFMLLAFTQTPNTEVNEKTGNAPLRTCRFIISCVYFWSGVQKMNIDFIHRVSPWFLRPLTNLLPEKLAQGLVRFGPLAALLEAGMGIGLLTRRWRHLCVFLAIAMHGLILFSIGPLGHNWDPPVWPWNMAMMLFVVILFWDIGEISVWEIVTSRRQPIHMVTVILFGIMPFFSYLEWWDSYASFALYSGNNPSAVIRVSESLAEVLPPEIKKHVKGRPPMQTFDYFFWSFEELHTVYPEPRAYRNIVRHLCRYAQSDSDVKATLKGRRRWYNGERSSTLLNCSDFEDALGTINNTLTCHAQYN